MKKDKKERLFGGWKVVQEYLLENKRSLIIVSVLGIVSALANGSVPYIVGRFFDALIKPNIVSSGAAIAMPAWLLFIALFAFVQITANVVDWENDKRSRKIGTFVLADYNLKAVSALLRLPLSFHKEHKTGEVWDRIVRAGNSISQIIEQVILPTAPQILGVCVSIAIAFVIKPSLASILLGGLGIYIVTLARIVPPRNFKEKAIKHGTRRTATRMTLSRTRKQLNKPPRKSMKTRRYTGVLLLTRRLFGTKWRKFGAASVSIKEPLLP